MTAYFVGDIPEDALSVVPMHNGEPIYLMGKTVNAELVSPAGVTTTPPASNRVNDVAVTLAAGTSPFDVPGVYLLRLTLTSPTSRHRLPAVPIIVETDDGWNTLASIRSEWKDAPTDDARLHALLTVAREQVEEYAPALAEDAATPPSYRAAQALQARNIWNAGKVDPASGGFGDDSYVIRPFPLDWTVRQLVRPRAGKPVVL